LADRDPHKNQIAEGHVAVARIIGGHGLRGDLKVEAMAPESCLAAGTSVLLNGTQREIERAQHGAKHPLLKLSGIDDRQTARDLRGSYIQVPEDSLAPLPEGQYYRFQLIGLAVRTAEGRDLGHIIDVIATGANDAYEIEGPLGAFLIPATVEVVQSVDLTTGVMTITPLPGLLPSA